tara:strand:+ start:13826 stop:14701 length:876 start_codon:yes stop_codon:yes gene_type:complete
MSSIDFTRNRHFLFQHKGYEDDWQHLLDCWDFILNTNNVYPKLLTYGELTDLDYLGSRHTGYGDFQLNKYVYNFFDNMDLELTIDNKIHLEIQEHNWVFHKIKVQWLINQYRTVGLYSPIQARFKKIPTEKLHKQSGNRIFVHPGMSRVHALRHVRAFDSKVIVWDPHEYIDKKHMTFDEWYNMFSDLDHMIFGTNVQGECLEMHVNEDRKDMYKTVKEIKLNMYKHKRPLLIGECAPDLEHLFRRDNVRNGVVIETDKVLEYEDLRIFLDLYPGEKEEIEQERISIRTIR